VAAVAAWELVATLREARRFGLAMAIALLTVIQLEVGVANGLFRLQTFGAQVEELPIPVSLLEAIKQLPTDAKLAYVCKPLDETGFTVPRLLSIDAHTDRRVVPMCFGADVFSTLIGAQKSAQVPNSSFSSAPQRDLYPDASADPPSAAVVAFLKAHGIDYIYVDVWHPNSIVTDAVVIARSSYAEVLRVP
jgi:hypothetical protein